MKPIWVTGALLSALTLSLTGCLGGGSSSSGGSGDTAPGDSDGFTGLVTDPPIEGASVRLVSAEGNTVSQVVRTDEQGRFELDADARDHWRDGARLLARGGVDSRTGQDFRSFTLAAPFGPDTPEEPVVSPLTTLVDHHLNHSAMGYEAALERVATQVGLTPDQTAALVADPAEHPRAQQASLLTADLLAALRGTETPWATLAQALDGANGDFAQAAQWLQMDELPEAVQHRLSRFEHRAEHLQDMAPGNAEAAIRAHGQANLHDGLAAFLERAYGLSDSDARQWGHALAEPVWSGMGDKGLPADAPALLNVGRYLLQHHLPETLDLEQLPEQAIATDTTLRELASRRVIDPTIPLGVGETLGMDNTARIHYFLRSEHAPYYRAERLFDDVFDDATTDPVFASIAHGMASAGLFEEARLLARANIFQPPERAHAWRRMGLAAAEAGDPSMAREDWLQALDIYDTFLREGKGVSNLDGDDASFFQQLSGHFRVRGYPDEADQTLAAVQEFIDSQQAQPYTTAYGRLLTAVWRSTQDAVERAEEAGLSGRPLADAREAVRFLREVTEGTGQQDSDTNCYAIRSIYVARTSDFALRVDDGETADWGIDEFERLINIDCNERYGGIASRQMASVYGERGRTDDFLALVTDKVENGAAGPTWADRARSEAVVYEALQLALDGDIEDATDLVIANESSVQGAIERLTHIGTGERDAGQHFLARLLWAQGEETAAREVTNRAWELALSPGFLDETDNPRILAGQGCRKVARLTQRFAQDALASQRMETCWQHVDQASSGGTTADRAEAAKQLATGYQWVGLDAGPLITTLYNRGSGLSDPRDRITNRRDVALLWSSGGDAAQAVNALDEAAGLLPEVGLPGAGEESVSNALESTNQLTSAYLELVAALRASVSETGALGDSDRQWIDASRQRVASLLLDDNQATNWPGAETLIREGLDSPADRESELRRVVENLASSRHFDDAEALARSAETSPERNRRLAAIGSELAALDDFPATTLARFDFDGDGRPDFFSPGSTVAEREASPLTLDTDIDGDGIPDFQDRTPYCPADTAGCWAP